MTVSPVGPEHKNCRLLLLLHGLNI